MAPRLNAKHEPFDVLSAMLEYETGTIHPAALVELFQYLVNTGLVKSLQGFYGRQAQRLLDAGKIKPAPQR